MPGKRLDQLTPHTSEPIEMIRFFFALPEPVALPDGFVHIATFPAGEPTASDPWAQVTFRQVEVEGGRSSAAMRAVSEVLTATPELPRHTSPSETVDLGIQVPVTVVDAVTTEPSPDAIPEAKADFPQQWLPRQDALTRCIETAQQAMRAHRQATEATYGLLSYVRPSPPVLFYTADAVREVVDMDAERHVFTRPTGDWNGASLLMLDHTNLADPFPGVEWDDSVAERWHHWMHEHSTRNPTTLRRERFIEAKRALQVTGDLTQSVLMANTSCETLLDVVLAMLCWEEGLDAVDAAEVFEEGKVLRRVTTHFPPRLRGNWSTSDGAVGDWYDHCYRLRHRIIHGGYSPSWEEASTAFTSATNLHAFLWDRLAERRTTYPRCALMTLAVQGLKKRGLWGGQIRRFSEEIGPTEPSWRESFSAFYGELTDAVFVRQAT